MSREIGSEFHRMSLENGSGIDLPREGTLVFSGRTAIEAVLSAIPKARTAFLPSYCCDSMIAPFIKAGIDVAFYDVNYDEGLKIELKGTADILLWCNYFGFKNEMPDFRGMIIEDITHSLLSRKQFHRRSNHLIASLRKWEPIVCGGYCTVKADYKKPPQEFVDLKSGAMELKREYLADLDPAKKPRFLSMFSQSNHWLSENCSGYAIDPWSQSFLEHVDAEKQRQIRRRNAHVLYQELKGKVDFLFREEDMDCPLFVPVLLKDRDAVRAKLIKEDIYCPVHWPRPEGCNSNIYDAELSLICDQRYEEDDMERLSSVLSDNLQ